MVKCKIVKYFAMTQEDDLVINYLILFTIWLEAILKDVVELNSHHIMNGEDKILTELTVGQQTDPDGISQ